MDNQIGFYRLPQILEIICVSKSAWWAGVAKGVYPASVKLGPRTTAWRKSDIFELVAKLSGGLGTHEREK